MKLHWGPVSPFVRKVMMAAHEVGVVEQIELKRSLVAMNAANADVMRDNPLSKIPTLVLDDGRVLFDSDVICEYLDTLHTGPKLVPASGPNRWQVLQWNALGSGLLDALILWRNERMRPEAHRSVDTLKAYDLKVTASLAWIEREIERLDAAPFGLGHIAIGCVFGYMDVRFADVPWRPAHPESVTWFERFSARPSAKATDPALGLPAAAPTSTLLETTK